MSILKFFVYGTLKKGGRFAKRFDNKRKSINLATAKGSMYSVGDNFPAVIFNENGGEIFGEIHEYKDEENVRKAFDLIEGFNKKNHVDNFYNRKTITVLDDKGNFLKCQTYEFNYSIDKLPKVDSGLWEI